jgi:hypothetical protein
MPNGKARIQVLPIGASIKIKSYEKEMSFGRSLSFEN